MSPGFEMFLQVSGVLVGAAGAWYAFKQYRLASAPKRDENRSAGSEVQTFICQRYLDGDSMFQAILGGAIGIPGLLWASLSEDDFEGPGHRLFTIAVFVVFVVFSVFMLGRSEAHFKVELSDRYFTVLQTSWRPREFRIAWDQVDHFEFSPQSSEKRKVIAVLPEGHGYLAGLPSNRYSSQHGGYEMCDLRGVEPSEQALRDAITRYSGLEVR